MFFHNFSADQTAAQLGLWRQLAYFQQLNPTHHYETPVFTKLAFHIRVVAKPIAIANRWPYRHCGSLPNETSNNTLYIGYLQGAFEPDADAQAYLIQGSTTLVADTVIYMDSTHLQVIFTLADAPVGSYNVQYVSSNGNNTLLNAFTIEPTVPYEFETVIEGQSAILSGTWRKYKVAVKNLSNQTAFGVPIYLKVSGNTEVELVSSTNPANLPTEFAEVDTHFFKVYDENGIDSVWLGAFTVLAIPPNSTAYINLKVKSLTTDDFTLQNYVGDPLHSFQAIGAILQSDEL